LAINAEISVDFVICGELPREYKAPKHAMVGLAEKLWEAGAVSN
jgi:hypothetical protein